MNCTCVSIGVGDVYLCLRQHRRVVAMCALEFLELLQCVL